MNGFPFFISFGRVEGIMSAENCATTSLAQLDSQMPLWLRHLAPELLQILLQSGIVRFFSQGHGKPAIRRR